MAVLSRGFSLIEMIITVSIIAILASASVVTHRSFTSQSALYLRASEVLEYVQYAQDLSSSSEILAPKSDLPTQGFQLVRVRVRDGLFKDVRIEKVPGSFSGFADGNAFDLARKSDVSGSLTTTASLSDRFFVDACFLDTDANSRYVRRKVGLRSRGSSDTSCASSVLCSNPDPAASGYDATAVAKHNFDIMITIEQPTREIAVNIVGVNADGAYQYAYAEPNGSTTITSNTYEGTRIVFIDLDGKKKSVDVYKTGLVSMQASDGGDGCGS